MKVRLELPGVAALLFKDGAEKQTGYTTGESGGVEAA